MSLIKMHFFSKALNRMTAVNIILPMPKDPQIPLKELPVLYLLHGMGDDYTMWIRRTNIEKYAIAAGLAVVMPDGGTSCYENMAHGGRFSDYLTQELPRYMSSLFPVASDREHVFIAGCSMGGCGALKLIAAAPEVFSRCGAFSAGHLEYRPENRLNREMIVRSFGEDIEAADRRINAQFERVAQNGPEISILHYWGDQDILRENALQTQCFLDSLRNRYIRYTSIEIPGSHDWDLWDECVKDFVRRLPLEKPARRLF